MTLTQILQKIRNAFYTKKEIDSMGGGTSLSDTISQKANDSDVVHKSGNETISGHKWFTGSTLYFNYANVDNVIIFADGEGGNIRLTDSDNNYRYEFDTFGKNYLRLHCGNSSGELTGEFYFHANGDFSPAQSALQNLGSPECKWKDVNTTLLNGKTPAYSSDLSNYLPKSGGNMTGTLTLNGKVVDTIEEQGDGYIRYVNGLQICWGCVFVGNTGDTAKGFTFTFERSFAIAPVVTMGHNGNQSGDFRGGFENVVQTSCSGFVYTTADTTIHIIAIGKWK